MATITHGINHFTMTPIHHQAAALIAQGKKPGEIAEYLGVLPVTLSAWKRSPAFQEILAEYRKEITDESLAYVKQQINTLQVKAIDRLDKLLEADSESVQLGAVREILERGPLRVIKQGEGTLIQPGQVILSERMIVAMRQVSSMVGDQEMMQVIEPVYQEVATPLPSEEGSEGAIEENAGGSAMMDAPTLEDEGETTAPGVESQG